MSIIISEKHIRSVIREAFKFSGGDEGSSYSRSKSSDSSTFDIGNFEYEDVADQSPAVRAKAELSDWVGKKETDPSVKEKLKQYWSAAGPPFSGKTEQAIKNKSPWSAAFISFVKSDPFFKSAAHITWKEAAEANTKAINANPVKFAGKEMYIALPIDGNTKINIGDNVWRPRDGGSHSDIVVGANKVIGGNLDNTVKSGPIAHDLVIKKVKVIGPKKEEEKGTGPFV